MAAEEYSDLTMWGKCRVISRNDPALTYMIWALIRSISFCYINSLRFRWWWENRRLRAQMKRVTADLERVEKTGSWDIHG